MGRLASPSQETAGAREARELKAQPASAEGAGLLEGCGWGPAIGRSLLTCWAQPARCSLIALAFSVLFAADRVLDRHSCLLSLNGLSTL